MQFLPEVCFGDDHCCDPDLIGVHDNFMVGVSLAKDQSIKLWE